MKATIIKHIESLIPHTTEPPAYSLEECPVERHTIECTKCSGILHQPVLLSCGTLVCSRCLVAGVRGAKGDCASCHHCNMPLQPSDILAPPDAIREIISSLPVVCGKCTTAVKRQHIEQHISSGCKLYIYTPPKTIQELAGQSPDTPVNKSELQVAGSILHRYRQQAHATGNDILQIPKGTQGGKVYIHVHVHVQAQVYVHMQLHKYRLA